MKKILLTNIGNRNITLDDNLYVKNLGEEKEISFKEWSKEILNDYDELKDKLDINIINPLVEGDNKAYQVYFYYSDQSQLDTFTGKDTLFEAEIMKKILIDKYDYKEEDIHLQKVDCKIINNGDLMKYYRKSLLQLKRKWKNHTFIICDAGGTGQQKMALKIMSEFMLDKDQYEIKYVEKNKLTSDVNIDEYRDIISTEQAIKLIHLGQYTAASELLGFDAIETFHKGKDWKKKIFAITYFRYISNMDFARKITNSFGRINDEQLNAFKKEELDFDTGEIDKVLSKKEIFKLTDYLHKAQFLIEIGQYSSSILTFSQFYEYLFNTNLQSIYGKNKLKKARNDDKYFEEFENWVKNSFDNEISACKKRYKYFRIEPTNLSTMCIIAKNSKSELIRKIAQLLSPHIEYTDDADKTRGFINSLRNKVAHSGLYLTQNDMKETGKAFFYKKLLNGVIKIFEFKNGNPFIHLNNLIEKNLRQ